MYYRMDEVNGETVLSTEVDDMIFIYKNLKFLDLEGKGGDIAAEYELEIVFKKGEGDAEEYKEKAGDILEEIVRSALEGVI